MDSNATAKKLVVYFSMPETTNPENMSREEELSTVVIDGEVLGNTQYVAYVITENTGPFLCLKALFKINVRPFWGGGPSFP